MENNNNISTTITTTRRDFGNKLSFNSVPSSLKRSKRATNYKITATPLSSSTQSLLELPPLIWVHILQYCTVRELVVLPIVCSTFRDILSPRTSSNYSTAIAISGNSMGGKKRMKPEDAPWDAIWDTIKFKSFSWKRAYSS